MGTAAEAGHTRARELSGCGLEMTGLDALDRLHDDRAAAIQVFLRPKLLAIFLEARGPAAAADVLPHAAQHPVLRVVKREVPRSEAERLALLVARCPPRDGVEGVPQVVQLRSEVRL